jgi:hypothetical protein
MIDFAAFITTFPLRDNRNNAYLLRSLTFFFGISSGV